VQNSQENWAPERALTSVLVYAAAGGLKSLLWSRPNEMRTLIDDGIGLLIIDKRSGSAFHGS